MTGAKDDELGMLEEFYYAFCDSLSFGEGWGGAFALFIHCPSVLTKGYRRGVKHKQPGK